MGLDGQAKMSKSLGNTIGLLDTPEEIWQKLRPAKTDPARVTRKDPGNPEVCNIYHLHKYFSPPATVAEVAENCRGAGWGCLDCKRVLADNMIAALAPIRERALQLQEQPERVDEILAEGAAAARQDRLRRPCVRCRDRMGFLHGLRASRPCHPERRRMVMEKIIKAAVERGASDLHIKAGDVFRARINGKLVAAHQAAAHAGPDPGHRPEAHQQRRGSRPDRAAARLRLLLGHARRGPLPGQRPAAALVVHDRDAGDPLHGAHDRVASAPRGAAARSPSRSGGWCW